MRTFVTDVKGKAASGYPTSVNVPMRFQGADAFVVPLKPRNGGGGKGCNCPVFVRRKTEQSGVTKRRNKLWKEQDDKSRMTGDCQVRFRERLGVKFPLPTRP